ncbi:MAG: hypothetical protein ACI8V4_001111 [Ilumatobacter sp.]|jgi:hypothetical protein
MNALRREAKEIIGGQLDVIVMAREDRLWTRMGR